MHALYGGGPTIAQDSTFPVYTLATKKLAMDPMGIENPLNLCFMISAIQGLMSVEQFNGYISRKSKFYNTDCFQITATTPKRNFTTTVT